MRKSWHDSDHAYDMALTLSAAADGCGVPEYMVEGLVSYILIGQPGGDFITAVLSNNLKEACNRADDVNRHKLWNFVLFLYNYAPAGSWGSEELYKAWLKRRGFIGQHVNIWEKHGATNDASL